MNKITININDDLLWKCTYPACYHFIIRVQCTPSPQEHYTAICCIRDEIVLMPRGDARGSIRHHVLNAGWATKIVQFGACRRILLGTVCPSLHHTTQVASLASVCWVLPVSKSVVHASSDFRTSSDDHTSCDVYASSGIYNSSDVCNSDSKSALTIEYVVRWSTTVLF